MSKYDTAPSNPEALDHLNGILKRADKEFTRQVTTWMKMVDVCWCAPVTHSDPRSMEDMQAIIDVDPAKFQMMLTDSVAQVGHFLATDPEAFMSLVKPRHLVEGAYVFGEGLTLVSLRPEWDVQPEEN